jgi:hypothetical protein
MYEYNNGMLPGGRTPELWIVLNGTIHIFAGEHILGVAAITSSRFEKNGKWSNTTYQLELAPTAVPCLLLADLHCRVWEENSRQTAYSRFCKKFGVSVPFEHFDATLATRFPGSYQRMLEAEAALASIPTTDTVVVVETKKMLSRYMHDDILVIHTDGRKWVIAHEAEVGTEIPDVARVLENRYFGGRRKEHDLTLVLSEGVTATTFGYQRDAEAAAWALGRGGDGLMPPTETPTTSGW